MSERSTKMLVEIHNTWVTFLRSELGVRPLIADLVHIAADLVHVAADLVHVAAHLVHVAADFAVDVRAIDPECRVVNSLSCSLVRNFLVIPHAMTTCLAAATAFGPVAPSTHRFANYCFILDLGSFWQAFRPSILRRIVSWLVSPNNL